eukprot:gnl/Spiro4/14428_TR7773_c0_g1_i2.p4 gnl/Spiro4/14428_TR7773_c0_g1~~gnl/Spiro4/14428_TR7773_c0_g1_i2.p4  ORF type:complete len:112 (-),score=21.34 gnl/Spiro4/14428_TR7773_c0_g1_i2:142-477(-)
MLERARKFVDTVKGNPYEATRYELRDSILRTPSLGEDWTTMFCAELVAEFLQQLGVLSEERHSNNYIPTDFSAVEHPHFSVVLERDYTLGPYEIIKTPETPLFPELKQPTG